jgi:nitronate monooxygenase
MNITENLRSKLRLPVIGSPMFIVSSPALVIAQCISGVAGTFPAAGARSSVQLDEWLCEIEEALAAWDRANPERPAAPYGVNQIVYRTNDRLEDDVTACIRHKTPLVICSLGAREDVNRAIQSYGGITLHDVIDNDFARKAIEKGANGIVAVAIGAGGHAGRLSPFPLIREIRSWFDGPLALAGAISTGEGILAAQAAGADFAYMGSAFIATREAAAVDGYKQAIIDGTAKDVCYTNLFTAVHGNYLRRSIVNAGLDPDNLPDTPQEMDFRSGGKAKTKVWRDIWACGQGIGTIHDVVPCQKFVEKLENEYRAALRRLNQIAA